MAQMGNSVSNSTAGAQHLSFSGGGRCRGARGLAADAVAVAAANDGHDGSPAVEGNSVINGISSRLLRSTLCARWVGGRCKGLGGSGRDGGRMDRPTVGYRVGVRINGARPEIKVGATSTVATVAFVCMYIIYVYLRASIATKPHRRWCCNGGEGLMSRWRYYQVARCILPNLFNGFFFTFVRGIAHQGIGDRIRRIPVPLPWPNGNNS